MLFQRQLLSIFALPCLLSASTITWFNDATVTATSGLAFLQDDPNGINVIAGPIPLTFPTTLAFSAQRNFSIDSPGDFLLTWSAGADFFFGLSGIPCRYDLSIQGSSNLGGSEAGQGPVDFMQCSGQISSTGSKLISLPTAGTYTLTETFTSTLSGVPMGPDFGAGFSNDLLPVPEPGYTCVAAVGLMFLIARKRTRPGTRCSDYHPR